MSDQKISITFNELTGEVILDAEGYHGQGCETAMKFLEEALPGEVVKDMKKVEWHLQNSNKNMLGICG